ncbi:Epididymal secretory protein E1 [Habropoda laboriosa]|uniref:Epididymal secretory protein E1 n=2 Tax=Habropoda laboriosa TaxID=597456 RepID=A0A0L7QMI2_9HYME|nr:Epididymal secretory protein E1 [Habropoda laboriosa]
MQSSFLPCDGKPGPNSVEILGCKTLPCNLKRGTIVEGSIVFTASASTKTLRPDVDVQLGNMHVKYPFPEQNACKGLVSGSCPLEKGEVSTYFMRMPIERAYPKIGLTIQFALVDEHNNYQMCFKIPAKVVD